MLGHLLLFGLTVPLGLDSYVPAPDDNPITAGKAALGQRLFRDPLLSRNRTISCASCHEPSRAFTDARPLAVGLEHRVGNRRTPAIVNRAFGKSFFWDGRVKSLEEQVLLPITNPNEMDLSLEDAIARLRVYGDDFRKLFKRDPAVSDLAAVLATYVRTILAGDSPYDRFVAGDRTALSAQAQQGLRLFRGKAGCVTCHVGFNLTDEQLHNTGAGKVDAGGRFKTPTLREVARHAPYMHDGSIASLADVLDFYDKGGVPNPRLDPDVRPLHLTPAEKDALLAFLQALSGQVVDGL